MRANTTRVTRWFLGWWQALPLPADPDSSCHIHITPFSRELTVSEVAPSYQAKAISQVWTTQMYRQKYRSDEIVCEELT